MIRWEIERPSPVPPSFVVKKGLKIFSRFCGSIPTPESAIVSTAYRTPCRICSKASRMMRPPSGVDCTAFLTRFQTTCLSCSASARIMGRS